MSVPGQMEEPHVVRRVRILDLLREKGPLDHSQICVELLEDAGAVEIDLNILCIAGLIVRRPDPGHPKDEALPETPWGLPGPFSL